MPKIKPPTLPLKPIKKTIASGGKKQRRSQEERRATTRKALLDATIECLVEYGYSGVTTTRVVERAGVSRGAQVHHFPTKAILVAEAVRHLARMRAEETVIELTEFSPDLKLADKLLDVLWHRHNDPMFIAVVEVWVAGRTDPELREHVIELEKDVSSALVEAVENSTSLTSLTSTQVQTLNTAMSAMRGLALINIATGVSDEVADRRWQRTKQLLLKMAEDGLTIGDVQKRG